jgi:hypothetical protein
MVNIPAIFLVFEARSGPMPAAGAELRRTISKTPGKVNVVRHGQSARVE